MAGYGAGPAMAYSDFYKNNSQTPKKNTDNNLNPNDAPEDEEVQTAAQRRQAALQRRLKKKKKVSV